jgi:hypothetical protein
LWRVEVEKLEERKHPRNLGEAGRIGSKMGLEEIRRENGDCAQIPTDGGQMEGVCEHGGG